MPVVKAQQARHIQSSAIAMDLSDVEEHARNILQHAQNQVAVILEKARSQTAAEAKILHDNAQRSGHDEGFKAGFDQGQAQGRQEAQTQHAAAIEQLIARWQQTLKVFQENLPAHLADARIDLVRLAIAIAATVTRQEGRRNPEVVKANAQAALALVTAGRHAVLCVHPDEISALEAYTPTLLAAFKNVAGIELEPDPSIEPGGCITRFGAGEVDARLDTQIQRIAEELLAQTEEDKSVK